MDQDPERYDVAVLGAHLTASLLAAILARNGARTVLIDCPTDRDRPTGETTVPYTAELFSLLAERYQVPEIGTFAHFTELPEPVRRSSGIKRSLGFVHHTAGERHAPSCRVQFNVPGEHTEWHLYRPEVDEYAREIAEKHGAHTDAERRSVLTSARHDPGQGAVLMLADGREVRARYVVDASSPDSVFLQAAGVAVRQDPPAQRSRVLSAYFSGVRPFEEVASRWHDETAWSHGTFHHVFDGGWIQIVDFGNHEASRNRLCSVTASVDPARFADLPAEPGAAFEALIGRYPDIAAQFSAAVPEGPWTDEPLWQRRPERTFGPGWVAIDRAAGRAEEVLSRAVTTGLEAVHATAAGLLRVLADPARESEEFARIDRFTHLIAYHNDSLEAGLRTAGSHFPLFNAYLRVWLLWQILADLSLKRARLDCEAGPGGSWAAVEEFDSELWFRTPNGLAGLLSAFFSQLGEVRAGRVTADAAARTIFTRLRRERFVPPLYRFGDPYARVYQFTRARRIRMLLWVKTTAPADFRRLLTRDNVTGHREEAPALRTEQAGQVPAA